MKADYIFAKIEHRIFPTLKIVYKGTLSVV